MSLAEVPPPMATVKGLVAGYYWVGSRLITRSCPVMTGVDSSSKIEIVSFRDRPLAVEWWKTLLSSLL